MDIDDLYKVAVELPDVDLLRVRRGAVGLGCHPEMLVSEIKRDVEGGSNFPLLVDGGGPTIT
mgnify:CR=1 FL=1